MADRRSRESTWKHGWPSVIVVVLVMVAAGFAVGVIAGITWEEPALVVGHLSGQTEAIDWGVGAEDPKAGGLAADDAIPKAGGLAADDAIPKAAGLAADDAIPKAAGLAADGAIPEPAGFAAEDAIPKPPNVAAAPPLGLRETPDTAGSDRATSGAGAGVGSTQKAAPAVTRPTAGFAVQVGAFSEKSAAQALADSLIAHGYPVYLSPTEGDPANWRVRVGPMSTRPEAEKTARRLEAAEKLPTWVLGEGS